jgi:BclB C-terminal domain-containing protein
VSTIGFGDGVTGITGGSPIDATAIGNMSFSLPRAGTITSLAAFFSTSTRLSLVGTSVIITAQVYQSTTPNNIFTAIPGALVNLSPVLTGSPLAGAITNGITTGLSIPVLPQTRLLLVFFMSAAGVSPIQSVTGYASARLSIL